MVVGSRSRPASARRYLALVLDDIEPDLVLFRLDHDDRIKQIIDLMTRRRHPCRRDPLILAVTDGGKPDLQTHGLGQFPDILDAGPVAESKSKPSITRQLGLKISCMIRSFNRSSRRGRLKADLLEGHDHPVPLHHVDQFVRPADTVLLQDVPKNVIIPGPGLVDGLADTDMDDPVAEQYGIQGDLDQQGGLAQAGPGHDQAHFTCTVLSYLQNPQRILVYQWFVSHCHTPYIYR